MYTEWQIFISFIYLGKYSHIFDLAKSFARFKQLLFLFLGLINNVGLIRYVKINTLLQNMKYAYISQYFCDFRLVPGLKNMPVPVLLTRKTRPAGEASSPANKNGRCTGAALLV